MTLAQDKRPTRRTPLRLWPGVVAAVLLCLVRFVVPIVVPGSFSFAVMGGLLGAAIIVLWWVFLSRAPWSERLGAVVLMVVGLVATPRIVHESVATAGMGMLFYVYAIPVLSLALLAWSVASRRLATGPRRASMVVALLLACGVWAVLRIDGVTGGAGAEFSWRWAATSEERLLAAAPDEPAPLVSTPAARGIPEEPLPDQAADEPAVRPSAPPPAEPPEEQPQASAGDEPTAIPPASAATEVEADWPGFRGPDRDAVISGVRIETDWSASPPVELWRRRIGPGWSSFAVRGDLLYTQEQRGDDEVVACHDLNTGEPVWRHRDAVRFWEANAGAGPRATPTVSGGRVYAFGATGILNVLDAGNGAVVWSRDAVSDTGSEVPYWGFSSSPLVVGDVVVLAVAGQLVAYDLATGAPRWFGPASGASYSSPHLLTIDGVAQILLLSESGATAVAPTDGTVLWQHPWGGFTSLQPALTADGDVLISTSGEAGGLGLRRVAVEHGPGGWTVEERWTSRGLKPYFNDFVVHDGHAFGFDGSILACINLEDGAREWKGGRYGHGQLVLLADQDVLLVLSEKGELALVAATPDQFTELARFPAIEGKTWNHPALVGDVLLARNGEEMVAFRLSLGDTPKP
ncbi:MAG: PQQ-like beta-propeller repeat protein [Acidobacteria bacterium]|nr:PQQ-like beta-propeller repeat protein [Acidobacteriota bacterium]